MKHLIYILILFLFAGQVFAIATMSDGSMITMDKLNKRHKHHYLTTPATPFKVSSTAKGK